MIVTRVGRVWRRKSWNTAIMALNKSTKPPSIMIAIDKIKRMLCSLLT
jgi:hypothetical protein